MAKPFSSGGEDGAAASEILYEELLTGAQATLDTGVLPASVFDNMEIILHNRCDNAAASSIKVAINNDTDGTNNYRGAQRTAGSYNILSLDNQRIVGASPGTGAPAGHAGKIICVIPSYSVATLHHQMRWCAGDARNSGIIMEDYEMHWLGGVGITRLVFQHVAGDFINGAHLTVIAR